MSAKTSRVANQAMLTAFLGLVGAASFSRPIRDEILKDDLKEKQNHAPGIENPNNVEIGRWVKFKSRKKGWRIGVLVAILGYRDGRIRLEENGQCVERRLRLLFPVR